MRWHWPANQSPDKLAVQTPGSALTRWEALDVLPHSLRSDALVFEYQDLYRNHHELLAPAVHHHNLVPGVQCAGAWQLESTHSQADGCQDMQRSIFGGVQSSGSAYAGDCSGDMCCCVRSYLAVKAFCRAAQRLRARVGCGVRCQVTAAG